MFKAVTWNIKSSIAVFYANISFTIIQSFIIKKMDITIMKHVNAESQVLVKWIK